MHTKCKVSILSIKKFQKHFCHGLNESGSADSGTNAFSHPHSTGDPDNDHGAGLCINVPLYVGCQVLPRQDITQGRAATALWGRRRSGRGLTISRVE